MARSTLWKAHPLLPILVSSNGDIKYDSKAGGGGLLTKTITSKRYHTVNIGNTPYGVHRLVAETYFDPPSDPSFVVHHKNHIRTDNNVENLAWISRADNGKDKLLYQEHNIVNPRDVSNANRKQEVTSYELMPDDIAYYDESLAYSPSQDKWYGAKWEKVFQNEGSKITGWIDLKEWPDDALGWKDPWHYWIINGTGEWFRKHVLKKSNLPLTDYDGKGT
jgi:hypothetical protein